MHRSDIGWTVETAIVALNGTKGVRTRAVAKQLVEGTDPDTPLGDAAARVFRYADRYWHERDCVERCVGIIRKVTTL